MSRLSPPRRKEKMKTEMRSTRTLHAADMEEGSSSAIRQLLRALHAMRDGDFSARLPDDWAGLEGKIADVFNEIIAANQTMARELQRVGHAVGREGKTRERTRFNKSPGAWGEIEVSVNTLID